VKLPLSWLTAMVDVDLPVDELVDVMSLKGLEVEDVTAPGAGAEGIRTARVLHWEPHPDADKLRVVRVTADGGDGEIELVCGAANFDAGDVVAHALPGGHVPGVTLPDGGRGLTLTSRRIRGVTSHGMLASARELELGDDHDGILVLPADTPLGASLTELLPIGEPVIEIAVQADRGDHLSVLGVARDLAAILDTTWHAPAVPGPVDAPTVPVTLATDGCERFVTWAVEDVTVQPSPLWLAQRLVQCGMRPIDLVVDVTNYVMLELGQPLHAFDLAALRGPALTVRTSEGGETLTTLDDQVRRLEAGDLVIDDAERPISLAGVMGGLDTEVTAATTRVLLEGAVWDPRAIRRTSRRLGLVSEASQRFERRVDPDGADRAVARAAQLLVELGSARAVGTDRVDADPRPAWTRRERITVDPARVRALLDLDLDAAAQAALLVRSGCEVEAGEDDRLLVTAPTWRGDLTRPADLAEEIARLYGYDAIPTTLPHVDVIGGLTPTQRLERQARGVVLAGGFHEAVTRPFVGEAALVGVAPSDGRVVLANPLAKDASAMRPSLLEGLLQALRRNVGQGRAGTALAEFGRIFRPVGDPLAAALDAAVDGDWRWRDPEGGELPVQPRALGLAAQGLRLGPDWLDVDDRWGVHDLLAVFDQVAARLAPPDDPSWRLTRVPAARDGLHPGRTAVLELHGHEVGIVGQLHPSEADRRDLPEPVVVGELLLEPFLAAVPEDGHAPVPAVPLVKHPALTVDVALMADDGVPYASLEAAAREGAGALLDGLWCFDEYRGAQVGEGRRSVAIRLRLQSPERQLTDADAEQVIEAVAAAADRVGASLRR
jgi:phenylalanyl-tRNA synthetase beta chain